VLDSSTPKPARRSRREAADASNDDAVDDFTTVGKGGKAMQFTADSIFKNLQHVQEARGKKVYLYPGLLHGILSII
jgi:translation initiation factor 3 subunit C